MGGDVKRKQQQKLLNDSILIEFSFVAPDILVSRQFKQELRAELAEQSIGLSEEKLTELVKFRVCCNLIRERVQLKFRMTQSQTGGLSGGMRREESKIWAAFQELMEHEPTDDVSELFKLTKAQLVWLRKLIEDDNIPLSPNFAQAREAFIEHLNTLEARGASSGSGASSGRDPEATKLHEVKEGSDVQAG